MGFNERIVAGNQVQMAKFANATMVVGNGEPFPIIFNQPGQEIPLFDGGIMSTGPMAISSSSDVTANSIDNGVAVAITSTLLSLTAAPFTVETVKPDGLGLSIITFTEG